MANPTGKGGFTKGKSGNPSGHPKGAAALAKYIREQTNDGKDLVNFFIDLYKGEELEFPSAGKVINMKDLDRYIDHRKDAARWLADRGFGQAAQIVIEDDQVLDPEIDQDELEFLESLTPDELNEFMEHERAIEAMKEKKKNGKV